MRPTGNAPLPCVVFAFNRPDKLQQVLSALRAQDIDRLVVFVDGPRDDADVELVERCRAIVRDVDWVERELHFRERNHGLPGLIGNIDEVFDAYEAAVFVEDDCLPMPAFYSFMRRALSRYEPEEQVFSIGGYQPIPPGCFDDYPYSVVSCARFTCWGWATWRDRWEVITPCLSRWRELFDGLGSVPDIAGRDLGPRARTHALAESPSWDVQMAISALWLDKVHLLPTRGLVRNTGVGSGVHKQSRAGRQDAQARHNRNVCPHSLENVVWLDDLELNEDYAERLKQFVEGPGQGPPRRPWRMVKCQLRRIPSVCKIWRLLRGLVGWLRRAARLLIPLPKYTVWRTTGGDYWRWQYEFGKFFRDSRILLNVNRAPNEGELRRALLVYTVNPFLVDRDSAKFISHTNNWRSRELARMLDELGYVVDVMHYTDYHSEVGSDYDLLLGFGPAEELAKELPQETIKIRLATGSEASFHNRRERERIEEVNRRRDCSLKPARPNQDKSELIKYFDAIACLGNEFTAATYRPFFDGQIHCFNNHGYDEWMGIPEGKDFAASRRNFLFFGGAGQVLLGLDLLLEVFSSRPNLRLYVCGPFEKEAGFTECYRQELYETENIVPVGWLRVGSSEYYSLVRKCGMVIVPICSGASTGSVVVCMGNGLIPIVTREAGIDTDGFGITLPSYGLDDIAGMVDWISRQPAEWHEEMSVEVLAAARQDFSQAAFSKRFREILAQVIEDETVDVPEE